jgi:type I restriction enzyme S subunit
MKSPVITDAEDHITDEAVKRSATNVVHSGSVLVVTRSGILRHSLPVALTSCNVALNQDLKALMPRSGVIAGYVAWVLRWQTQNILARCAKEGTTVQSIDTGRLLDFEIPLAPTAEQERIVAAIEEEFSRIDAGMRVLDSARARLDFVKQAELFRLVGYDLGDNLPAGWRWTTVAQVAGDSQAPVLTGPFGTSLGRFDFTTDGVAVLTIGCITSKGIDTTKAPRVSEAKAATLSRYALRPGDVLFSRMATVGRAAVVNEATAGSLINYHLMRLRLATAQIRPDFLVLLCRGSSAIQRHLRDVNHGVTRPGVNTKELLAMPVALPPLPDQDKVIAQFQEVTEMSDCASDEIQRAGARASVLRSVVLAAALSGQLVPQRPSDEPVTNILERITAERPTSKGHKPRRATKPRTTVPA